MFPRLFSIPAFELFGRDVGPLTLHSYGVLLATAFLAGLWVAGRQARKEGLPAERVTDLAIYVLIAGLVGAKLLLVIVDWDYYSRNLSQAFSLVQSGGVFYGGLIGAFPVAWWYSRRHSLDGWRTADALAPGVAIGQAIGRLGCLCAGCCFGLTTDLPWGVTFTDVYAARNVGVPLDMTLHPTQLYESAATLALLLVLLWMSGRKRFHGQVALSYISLYASFRFAIEFFRGDPSRGSVFQGLLSTSQFIALLMLASALAIVPWLLKKRPARATTP